VKVCRELLTGVAAVSAILAGLAPRGDAQATSAWSGGTFHVETAGVVGRSDIVLERANMDAGEAMPLGNGHLGAAVWSAEGMTVQLNRADTMPRRLSAGQLVIPGLARLTQATDYAGRLDLYHGAFVEHGGGITATAYVEPYADALVVEVAGADPAAEQTVQLRLWEPRAPIEGKTQGAVWFAERWTDNKEPGASNEKFGSLAVVTADGRNMRAEVTDKHTLTLHFWPDASGHFRVLAAAPHYDGSTEPEMAATRALTEARAAAGQLALNTKWKNFWQNVGLMKITSADGAGEYMENLRMIYLYVAACERGDKWPGSQAGVADMISAARDVHQWDPAAFWHWNLRMQVAANIGAGVPDMNLPYFDLYLENLDNLRDWTRVHMNNMTGICVPETMRFNGQGIEYEGAWTPPSTGMDCAYDSKPYYNARTLTTGAEIGLWVWRQYEATGDQAFLEKYFPLMGASARFLLAAQHEGKDGKLHTSPSNAHETQWDVTDPTTDLAAIKELYPVVDQATQLLDEDRDLAYGLRNSLDRTPDFPRVGMDGSKTLLSRAADAEQKDVIADSYQPAAEIHNVENIGLEPVWPYNQIGDRSNEFPLAVRTYQHRPNVMKADWSYDPVQAARLDMGAEVGSTLKSLTEVYQRYPNGMAKWSPNDKEFYVEQTGVAALALQEALVQDYDGVIRIAPAVPPGWDMTGSVWVRNKTRVDVEMNDGAVTMAVIEAGATETMSLRNPWPGESVEVLEGKAGKKVSVSMTEDLLRFNATGGMNYAVRPLSAHAAGFAAISGIEAQAPKRLGAETIGLFAK
jgi:Glycosyl hydrolase family 95 catalytic domain